MAFAWRDSKIIHYRTPVIPPSLEASAARKQIADALWWHIPNCGASISSRFHPKQLQVAMSMEGVVRFLRDCLAHHQKASI